MKRNDAKLFYSPIEGNDTLIKKAVLDDSIYHVFLSIFNMEYNRMKKEEEKKNFVKQFQPIIERITLKREWETYSHDTIGKVYFLTESLKNINLFYKYIFSKNPSKTDELTVKFEKHYKVYDIITSLVRKSKYEDVFRDVCDEFSEHSIKDVEKEIVEKSKELVKHYLDKLADKIDKKKIESCIELFAQSTRDIVKYSQESAYNSFIKNNRDVVSSNIIQSLCDKFKCDCFVIKPKTTLPYAIVEKSQIHRQQSIIVFEKSKNRYESIGRMITTTNHQYLFDGQDVLIDRIYTFLYCPEEIEDRYPSLIPYMNESSEMEETDDDSDVSSNLEENKPNDKK